MLASWWYVGQTFKVLWELRVVSRGLKHYSGILLPLQGGQPLQVPLAGARSTPNFSKLSKVWVEFACRHWKSTFSLQATAILRSGSHDTCTYHKRACVKLKCFFLKKLKTYAQHPSHLETTVRCHNLQTLGSHYSLSSRYTGHHWCLTTAGQ